MGGQALITAAATIITIIMAAAVIPITAVPIPGVLTGVHGITAVMVGAGTIHSRRIPLQIRCSLLIGRARTATAATQPNPQQPLQPITPKPNPVPAPSSSLTSLEKQLIDLVNQERTARD